MSLIIETGAGLASAESYCSEAEADDYHEKRGNADWNSVADKEAALRKATDYLIQNYRASWKGVRATATQALDWPRGNVYIEPFLNGGSSLLLASDIVPVQVKNACAELALKAASADLNPDLGKDVISQTVGPISTIYSAASPSYKRYRAIDMLLRPYLQSQSSCNVSAVRT